MIKLKNEEVDFLISLEELDQALKSVLKLSKSNNYEMEESFAEELRDACADLQILIGFDENYELNKNGIKLVALIDKLFRKLQK